MTLGHYLPAQHTSQACCDDNMERDPWKKDMIKWQQIGTLHRIAALLLQYPISLAYNSSFFLSIGDNMKFQIIDNMNFAMTVHDMKPVDGRNWCFNINCIASHILAGTVSIYGTDEETLGLQMLLDDNSNHP